MLPNQQFYHDAAEYHAAEVQNNLDLAILVAHIRDHIGIGFSPFDYELICSYVWAEDFGAPSSLLEFTRLQLRPHATELQTLSQIPTFPESQWATAYWLCEPVRLHA